MHLSALRNVIILFAAFLNASVLCQAAEGTKRIVFPDGKWSIGQLYRLTPVQDLGENHWKPVSKLGPARGNVDLDKRIPVMLVVSLEGVENLSALEKLKPDDLQAMRISDVPLVTEKFKPVLHLTGLEQLELASTDIDSSVLPLFSKLPNLVSLDVSRTEVTDSRLDQLRNCKNLRRLVLKQNDITDSGIAKLSACTNITHLNILDCKISNKSIAHLTRMKQLKSLNISSNGLTDSDLSKLAEMKNLRRLTIGDDKITESGIKRFERLAPKCKVSRHKVKRIRED